MSIWPVEQNTLDSQTPAVRLQLHFSTFAAQSHEFVAERKLIPTRHIIFRGRLFQPSLHPGHNNFVGHPGIRPLLRAPRMSPSGFTQDHLAEPPDCISM